MRLGLLHLRLFFYLFEAVVFPCVSLQYVRSVRLDLKPCVTYGRRVASAVDPITVLVRSCRFILEYLGGHTSCCIAYNDMMRG